MGVVRNTCRSLLRRTAGLVERLSPGTVHTVADSLRRAADYNAPAARFSLQYRDTRFDIDLVDGCPFWYRTFSRWAAGVDVYELVMLECLTRLVHRMEAPAFIDIGAFVGHYAQYVSALTDDRSAVYAIESNPRYCAAIERATRLNEFSTLKVYNVVLSDRTEVAGIEEHEVRFNAPGLVSAQTTTLDELCQREGIRPVLAKIDLHGTEGKVLGGMRAVMRDSLEFMLLELHSEEWLHQFSGAMSRVEVLPLLEDAGFHVFSVAGHRWPGTVERQRAVQAGALAYRRMTGQTSDLLLFDRPGDVLLLCSKGADVEPILAPLG
jgi:FkbM family methyltransferase